MEMIDFHGQQRPARYLGDGVYIESWLGDDLKLFTSDGVTETNTIYLEPEVAQSLMDFIKNYYEVDDDE